MKQYKTGEWIPIAERMPNNAEKKRHIILYYYEPEIRLMNRGNLSEIITQDSLYGNRIKTHWMKIDRPTEEPKQ